MATLNFNAKNVEPAKAFDPVPSGWYPVKITDSEMKQNSKKNGHFLEMIANVIEGEYMNRKLYISLNVDNPNETTVTIANEQLSAICHAVNVLECADSSQLHGIPFEMKVTVKPAKDGYDAKNEAKGFRALEGSAGVDPGSDAPDWASDAVDETVDETVDAPITETKAPPVKKAPPTKAKPVLEMLDTEFSYDEWIDTGRNDQDMVDEGLARWVNPTPPVKKAPPAKKAAPAKKTPPVKQEAATSTIETLSPDIDDNKDEIPDMTDDELPPWMQDDN